MIAKKSIANTIFVYLMLFSSGAILFQKSADRNLILIFLLVVLTWGLFSDRKLNDRFILYVCLFAGFQLIINLYTGGSLGLFSIISATMKLVLAYLVLKMAGNDFVEIYIKVVVILAGASLVGFISDQFYLFENIIRMLPRVGDNGYEGVLYLFRYRFQGYDRNNSIFFEPGAYQGFLNAALFMLFFAKTKLSASRRWSYILLLVITLFTTFSTTGFLMFGGMLGLFLVKGKLLSNSGKFTLIALVLACIAFFSTQFQEVIFDKIEAYTAIEEVTDNDNRRSFDALVDVEVFKRNWFGLGYTKYYEEFARIGVISNKGSGSSNGVTKTLAVYGLPFALFLFGSYYWSLRKICEGELMSIVAFGMVLMFLVGESYYILQPATLAIIVAMFVFDRSEVSESKEYKAEVAS